MVVEMAADSVRCSLVLDAYYELPTNIKLKFKDSNFYSVESKHCSQYCNNRTKYTNKCI